MKIQKYKPLARIIIRVPDSENEIYYIPLIGREAFEKAVNTQRMVRVGDVTIRSTDVLRIEENKGYVVDAAVRKVVEAMAKKFYRDLNRYPKPETIKKWELEELASQRKDEV